MSNRWTIERAVREKPPGLHPLAGANFTTFWRKFLTNGPYEKRSRHPRLSALAAVHVRFPFSTFQRLWWGGEIMSQHIEHGPVFIVGHWRSGTTHLHNIISQDPQFGWISLLQTNMPWDIMLEKKFPIIRKIMDDVIPEKRGTDNVAFTVDSPQEEEWAIANMTELSFFNSYYFPRDYMHHYRRGVLLENTTARERRGQEKAYERLVKSLHIAHGGKQLLIKNPSATARMPMLKKLFPNARFVHIVRNPFAVYASSLARHPRLMNAFAWQKFTDVDFESICFECYETLMKRYLEDREKIPAGDLVETSYEKLVQDPVGVVKGIYDAFDIPLEKASLDKITAYLDAQKDYRKNVHKLTRRQVDHIENNWGFAFDEWQYERPEIEISP